MAVPVIMPKQGQSVETCIITQWIKKKGDTVNKGDVLFSYETDKASFDAEAEEEGVLLEVFYLEGDEVPVLSNVAVIGRKGDDIGSLRPGAANDQTLKRPAEEEATVSPGEPAAGSKTGMPKGMITEVSSYGSSGSAARTEIRKTNGRDKLRISPRARAMASNFGINPMGIKGSGPNGRVIVRDIETAAKGIAGRAKTILTDEDQQMNQSIPGKDYIFGTHTDYEDRKLSNIRKLIARSMHESITLSAQLTHHLSADVRRLLSLRAKVKAEMDKGRTINVTLNDMVCFAVIRALGKFPEINSHFLGDSIRTFKKVHLGLAVDTQRGLMVPAVPDASDYSLQGLSDRLAEVADQCRKGGINPELLVSTAASFTVSNLGKYGVEMFTPIINLPQVAILGVNTITWRPDDLGDGVIGFIPVMGLSLTYDHRAVDGGPATLFLKEIKDQIENFNESL
ncbi:MAG: 2-oxo acid dehydrogenase subunit E2 [Bacteroidales bacterium]|nr:2-oxo acid dehydrogenase subunit E2 [Bacteroidales bacterium]